MSGNKKSLLFVHVLKPFSLPPNPTWCESKWVGIIKKTVIKKEATIVSIFIVSNVLPHTPKLLTLRKRRCAPRKCWRHTLYPYRTQLYLDYHWKKWHRRPMINRVMSMWYFFKLETIIFGKFMAQVNSDSFDLFYLSTRVTIGRWITWVVTIQC